MTHDSLDKFLDKPLERPMRADLDDDERHFVERLNAAFAPEPLSATRRAALDERLRSRIERRRWSGMWTAGLTTAAVAATIVGFGLPAIRSAVVAKPGIEFVQIDPVGTDASQVWEQQLLFGDPGETTAETEDTAGSLPPEYAAIDSLFFDS